MAVTKVTPDGLSTTLLSKNLFHNGDFAVRQRGDVTGLGAVSVYTMDGVVFLHSGSPTGRFSALTSTTVPANTGHRQSLKVDITTADTSIAAAALYYMEMRLEAQNVSHLRYGESDAKSLTISFWTRSSTTGDYNLMVEVPDGSRAYAVTYNIASADTWEKKTITIAGDTGGTINNDTGVGITLRFGLTGGSNFQGGTEDTWKAQANNMVCAGMTLNLFSSTSNDWYMAGLQVEEGSVATDFDFQDEGTTLARCQRYFKRLDLATGDTIAVGGSTSTTVARGEYFIPQAMRADPTVTLDNTSSGWRVVDAGDTITATTGVGTVVQYPATIRFDFTTGGSLTANSYARLQPAGARTFDLSAEL